MKDTKIIVALKRIAKQSGGVIKPESVVDAARPESSPLHSRFTWDDTEAAEQYRLWQARTLIRTQIKYIEVEGKATPFRVFVSLTPDREEESGGYRVTANVLNDKDMRAQMLRDAMDEMRRFEAKYAGLKELAELFAASRKVREQMQ